MDDIYCSIFTERDLFGLDVKVDTLFKNEERFRQDGIMKFTICTDSSRTGRTQAQTLIKKYGPVMKEHTKRLNPVRLVGSNDAFGHISIDAEYLPCGDVDAAMHVLRDIESYEVVVESNCCMQALEGGKDILMEHLHREVWRHSKMPPSYCKKGTLKDIRKEAAKRGKKFDMLKTSLEEALSPSEMAAIVQEDLAASQEEDQCRGTICKCYSCVIGDDVLDENSEETDAHATASHYGARGFMYASGINVDRLSCNFVSTHFSLSYLASVTCSKLINKYYPGISTSYMFFGMQHSFAPIHNEDMSLWSINYVHHGYPKVWVGVSPTHICLLRDLLCGLKASGAEVNCRNLLSHKYFLVTIQWLRSMDISYKVVVQCAGEGIIVSPNAAHMVFNLGPNIAEAINFASISWLPYGIAYQGCSCMVSQIHMDLQPLVAKFYPEHLSSTWNNKVLIPEDRDYFFKSTLDLPKWREATVTNDPPDLLLPDEVDGNVDNRLPMDCEESGNVPQEDHVRRRPRRRPIQCPICMFKYQGGHKQRLDKHIASTHSKMTEIQRRRVQDYYNDRFPQRGNNGPKRQCDLCGAFLAGSMKRHKASSACKVQPQ